MNESNSPFSGRLVLGLILLSLGLMWTADNLGFINASHVLNWWPLLLLAFGLTRLFGWGSNRQILLGALCTTMGALMLATTIGWLHAGLGLIWPLAMVALGIEILLRGSRAGGATGILGATDDSDYVRTFALMGGASTRCTSQALRGAELSAFMGGVELDLRDARPVDGRVVVDAFAFMGGIDIAVPSTWDVEFHATPLIGGMADTRMRNVTEPHTATLVVRGVVVLGGLQIGDEPTGHAVRAGVHGRRRQRERYVRWEGGEAYVGPEGVRIRTGRPDRPGEKAPGPEESTPGTPPPAGPPDMESR